MRIRIVCPVSLAYEGDAAFVSIPSTDGEFGVFTCSLQRNLHDRPRLRSRFPIRPWALSTTRFAVAGGYAQVAEDVVTVLAERACDLATVDATRLKLIFKVLKRSWVILSEDDARRAYLYNENRMV